MSAERKIALIEGDPQLAISIPSFISVDLDVKRENIVNASSVEEARKIIENPDINILIFELNLESMPTIGIIRDYLGNDLEKQKNVILLVALPDDLHADFLKNEFPNITIINKVNENMSTPEMLSNAIRERLER